MSRHRTSRRELKAKLADAENSLLNMAELLQELLAGRAACSTVEFGRVIAFTSGDDDKLFLTLVNRPSTISKETQWLTPTPVPCAIRPTARA